MLVCSLPVKRKNKNKKKLAPYVIDTCAIHLYYTDLVHDVITTDCQTQNGSAHSGVFATFKCRFLTHKTIYWPINWCFLKIFISVTRAHHASLLGVPFKLFKWLAPSGLLLLDRKLSPGTWQEDQYVRTTRIQKNKTKQTLYFKLSCGFKVVKGQ